MKLSYLHMALVVILITSVGSVHGQETVFSGMQSNWKKAEKNYQRGSYEQALQYYLAAESQKKTPKEVALKIALTYVKLNDHEQAVHFFEKYKLANGSLPSPYKFQMAESLTSLGRYTEAISWYRQFGKAYPQDARVMQKIWRLTNIEYLYEDSTYYAVSLLPFNTPAMEYAPIFFDDQLIYVSNREEFGGVKVLDGVSQKPFYKRYALEIMNDSLQQGVQFQKIRAFAQVFDSKHHHGPISISEDGRLAVFTQSSSQKDQSGTFPMQLYYSERVGESWSPPQPIYFQMENEQSISNPCISADGNTLYFSADWSGGAGGKDIYQVNRTVKGWSSPQNLGADINTSGDEDFPFIHPSGVLYFASNGHGGLGGLDLFKVPLYGLTQSEVKNLGYPVNTQYDDFGIFLNTSANRGYMCSNRADGGLNDDIYHLEIDLQTYPLTIQGTLKYRNDHWQQELQISVLKLGEIQVFDAYNGRLVYETATDEEGKFSLQIPYSSQFKIKVIHEILGEHSASLEIPKNKKEHLDHEIILVKDQFKSDYSAETESILQTKKTGHEVE